VLKQSVEAKAINKGQLT